MAPKDSPKTLSKDDEAKASARVGESARAARPGAVSVAAKEAARMDDRIDGKNRAISSMKMTSEDSVHPGVVAESSRNSKLAAKMQSGGSDEAKPGALQQLHSVERDIYAKMQCNPSAGTSQTKPGALQELHNIESALQAKMRNSPPAGTSWNSDSSDNMVKEAAKRGSGAGLHPGACLSSTASSATFPLSDAAVKERARAGAVAERLDSKIDAKVRGNSVRALIEDGGATATARDMDASIQQKIQNNNPVIAARHSASLRDADVHARTDATAIQELRNIESSIQSKIGCNHKLQADSSSTTNGVGALEGLRSFESNLTTKLNSASGVPSLGRLANMGDTVTKQEVADGANKAYTIENLGVSISKDSVSLDHDNAEASILHKSHTANVTGDQKVPAKSDKGAESELHNNPHDIGLLNDVEYGEYGSPEEKGLAVAFAVEEEDEAYIPSAVEFDPDAKPPIYRNRRFRLYAAMATVVALVGTLGAVAGRILSKNSSLPAALPYRATLGIREYVEHLIGTELLNDPGSPYRKALDWIQDIDPMALTPESNKFTQRYISVYFYFATSTQKEWSNGCEPSMEEASNDCVFHYTGVQHPSTTFKIDAKRWLSFDDVCLWAGVTCDESDQVRMLDFAMSNMTGTFPEGISHLPGLQFLSMSHGGLKGTLPTFVGDMKHLMSLELLGNQWSGVIPDSWYFSRSLQKLNLGNNRLTGTISKEVKRWKDVRGFFVQDNVMKGSIPLEIGDMRSLSFLWMSGNLLTGTLPGSLGNLRVVRELMLHRNQLDGTLPTELGTMELLWDFRLHVNQFNGTIPNEMARLSHLENALFSHNQLTGSIAPLTNMTILTNLRIEKNSFSGTLPTELGLLRNLEAFDASGNNLVGTVPNKLCNLVVPKNVRGSKKVLSELVMDCTEDSNEVTEVDCSCCTSCCESDGNNCVPIQ